MLLPIIILRYKGHDQKHVGFCRFIFYAGLPL